MKEEEMQSKLKKYKIVIKRNLPIHTFDFEVIHNTNYTRYYNDTELDKLWKQFIERITREHTANNLKYKTLIDIDRVYEDNSQEDSFEIIDTYSSFVNNKILHPTFSITFSDKELWNTMDMYSLEQLWYQANKDIDRMDIKVNSIRIKNSIELECSLESHINTTTIKKIAYLCSQTFLAKPFILLQEFIWKQYDETMFIGSSPNKINLNIFLSSNSELHFILYKKLTIHRIQSNISKEYTKKCEEISTLFSFYIAFKNNCMFLFSPKQLSI